MNDRHPADDDPEVPGEEPGEQALANAWTVEPAPMHALASQVTLPLEGLLYSHALLTRWSEVTPHASTGPDGSARQQMTQMGLLLF